MLVMILFLSSEGKATVLSLREVRGWGGANVVKGHLQATQFAPRETYSTI